MREKISVIVPVYGVEKMLARCVESILAQTYENIELVLVDDGSPDQCPAICDQYAEKYKNIVVIHKKNGGLTSAWKAGVTAATGDLLGFVDSDDYIDPTMFEDMLMMALKEDSDICICDFKIYYEKEKKTVESNDQKIWKKFIKTVVDKQNISTVKSQMLSLSPVPWRKIYKKVFLIKIIFAIRNVNSFLKTIHCIGL